MVVVTHEIAFARSVADRVAMFDHGMLIELASPDQIFQNASHERTRRFLRQLLREGVAP
jgi:ABC-type polar amino acid transport system ATPase subunit